MWESSEKIGKEFVIMGVIGSLPKIATKFFFLKICADFETIRNIVQFNVLSYFRATVFMNHFLCNCAIAHKKCFCKTVNTVKDS